MEILAECCHHEEDADQLCKVIIEIHLIEVCISFTDGFIDAKYRFVLS